MRVYILTHMKKRKKLENLFIYVNILEISISFYELRAFFLLVVIYFQKRKIEEVIGKIDKVDI